MWPRLANQSVLSTLATWICSSVDIRSKGGRPEYFLKLDREILGRRRVHSIEVAELWRLLVTTLV